MSCQYSTTSGVGKSVCRILCPGDTLLGLCLMCSKFNLLFFPAIPKKFTHYSYFMLLLLPIIFIKFFLAILHVGSSGVVNVAGAAVKRVL